MKPTFRLRARLAIALLVALCAGLAGCSTASTYQVKVDAMAKPSGKDPQSYKIKNKDPRRGEDNLREREAAEFIRTALSGKGLYEAPTEDRADMIVELDYGVDAPRAKVERVSVPIYAQVGGGVRYESVPVVDTRGNAGTRTVAVYDPPRTQLIGYDEVPQIVTIYEKYLKITARENKPDVEGRPPAELWSVHASAEDESKDLRKYLPIMASASVEYIGAESANPTVVKVRTPSDGVDFIRRGMGDAQPAAVAQTTEPPKG